MEQKKFDINSFIGMILLGGILLYWINTNKPDETIETSIKTEQVVASSKNSTESSNLFFENDSLKKVAISNALGAFSQSA
ncbi:MAG: membrane protein insertase YidC, partial [Polaribacter sp.]|nr:membrane protein insertase YidC [Polaribacter sp.]